jgi:hypothetical protein
MTNAAQRRTARFLRADRTSKRSQRVARTAASTALIAAAGAGIALGGTGVAAAHPNAAAGQANTAGQAKAAADLNITSVWTASFANDHLPFALSSPVLAELANGPAIVAGDRAGHVYAVYLQPGSKGGPITAWTVTTNGPKGPVGVDSSPSSSNGVVYFGIGWAGERGVGGYEAINPSGARKWFEYATNPSSDPTPDAGVAAGLSVGDLQSQTSVVGPSLGQNTYLFNAGSGARLPGFPWFQADTNFSTAAIADVEGNGQNQIIEGGNTTAGTVWGTTYINGGQIRILNQVGNSADTAKPNSGLYCEYTTDQGVDSSPAVGDILNGQPGIVVGTSTERPNETMTDDVIAIDNSCHHVWSATLDGATTSSPALADVLGNGNLQVIEGTQNGYVYALNSLNGEVHWKTKVPGVVIGGVVTADLGNGYQDVVVPSTAGAFILDGKTGAIVKTLEDTIGLQNSPIVTDDANGTIGITIAGYTGAGDQSHAAMEHFEVVGSNGSTVNEAGAWPEFHHDPQLTGNADVAVHNLVITTKSLPGGTVGASYNDTMSASGGAGTYVWSRTGGAKPPGLAFSTSGTWSGTPTASGTYTFPIQVTDRALVVTEMLTISVH